MRTTIRLNPDVGAAIEQLGKRTNQGVSEAVNELIRRGLKAQVAQPSFVPRTHPLGLRIDMGNIAEALELLEGPAHR